MVHIHSTIQRVWYKINNTFYICAQINTIYLLINKPREQLTVWLVSSSMFKPISKHKYNNKMWQNKHFICIIQPQSNYDLKIVGFINTDINTEKKTILHQLCCLPVWQHLKDCDEIKWINGDTELQVHSKNHANMT